MTTNFYNSYLIFDDFLGRPIIVVVFLPCSWLEVMGARAGSIRRAAPTSTSLQLASSRMNHQEEL